MFKNLTPLLLLLNVGLLPNLSKAQCYRLLCSVNTQTACDFTDNNPFLWNTPDWWDPVAGLHDLADAVIDPAMQVLDTCDISPKVRFQLLLDLDADSLFETLIDGDSLDQYPSGMVPFGNFPDPQKAEWRLFDTRPLPIEKLYRFSIQSTVDTMTHIITYHIRWNTTDSATVFNPALVPYGKCQAKWIAESDNLPPDTCIYNVNVRDCKNPVFICNDGLVATLLPPHQLEIFASDLLLYAEDNYTPVNKLQLAVRRSGTGSGFPLNPDGTPVESVVFDCDDIGSGNFHIVELWARDLAGNVDYCETFVIVQDNYDLCNPIAPKMITFCLEHCDHPFPTAVDYEFTLHPALPPIWVSDPPVVTPDGCTTYTLHGFPANTPVTITPVKDNDQLNGVSTYDLVRIARHILGTEPLDSPEKIVAADVNNSRSITTFDLVELQKLVLGIYPELPNNTSWRFYPAGFVFPDPTNPFQTQVAETVTLDSINGDTVRFTGIKIGNVTCNTGTEFPAPPQAESLPAGASFCVGIPKLNLQTGDTVLIPLTAVDGGEFSGYQFDLLLASSLKVVDLIPGSGMSASNFGVFGSNGIHVSWFNAFSRVFAPGEALFFIKITASQPVSTESNFTMPGVRIRAEGYNAAEEVQPFSICYTESVGVVERPGTLQVSLQPNPAGERAWLLVSRDAVGPVRVEIFDVTGRSVLSKSLSAPEANQPVEIPLNALPPGHYEYRVTAAAGYASGKLIKL